MTTAPTADAWSASQTAFCAFFVGRGSGAEVTELAPATQLEPLRSASAAEEAGVDLAFWPCACAAFCTSEPRRFRSRATLPRVTSRSGRATE